MSAEPGFMSIKRAAVWAGVSERTVKRWIVAGLPVYQAGPHQRILVSPADIQAFLTRKQAPTVDLKAMADAVYAKLLSEK